MTNKQKIKVGFVALGDHALHSHLKHMLSYTDVEVIGAFDPDRASFHKARQDCGADLKNFDSYEAMLGVVEGVIICSPDKFHTDQLAYAAQKGVHALCEKPLCIDEKSYEQLENIFKTAKTVITSCHPRRFDPPYVWVKDNLEKYSLAFGKVLTVDIDFTYHKPSEAKHGLHGNSLLQDHANHEIDYVNFLLGPESMTAYKLADMYDRYEMAGSRKDGVVFRFQGTRRLESRTFAESIRIRFDRGELYINTYEPNLSYSYNHETRRREAIPAAGKTDYDIRFDKINRNFIDAIKQGNAVNYLKPDEMLLNSKMSIAFHNGGIFNYTHSSSK
ncbi:MAG: Gfo/Idh/MocA family oxidoreductase [Proteobacteria bacterium]|nr:Gfo/Idh/MocA family oxidoreductase [Pseudomonadota bacterium]